MLIASKLLQPYHKCLLKIQKYPSTWLLQIGRASTSLTSFNTENAERQHQSNGRKRIVFLGTPDVSVGSLRILLDAAKSATANFEVVAVVSQPPSPSGRKMKVAPSPVHLFAEMQRVPVLIPSSAKDESFLDELSALQPDLCVTVAYGNFLPKRFLEIPMYGTLNIHPSLLPLYRGAAPVQRCLQNGDRTTGVTLCETVLKMDAGPVVKQEVVHLHGNEHAPILLQKLIDRGTHMLVDTLPGYFVRSNILNPRKIALHLPGPRDYGTTKITTETDIKDKGEVEANMAILSFPKIEQDHLRATAARKISTDESYLNLAEMTAQIVHNRTRAFSGWPGVWMTLSLGSSNRLNGVGNRSNVKVKIISTVLLPSLPAVQLTNKIEILKVSLPLHSCPVWDANTERVTCDVGYDHIIGNANRTGTGDDAIGENHPNRYTGSSPGVIGADLVGESVERHVLRVVCADGLCVGILHMQPAGRRVMDARSFVNGLQGQSLEWV